MNYAELDDDKLRRVIARKTGWSIQIKEAPDMPKWDYSCYVVTSPSGDRTCYADEEEAIWSLPDWPREVNDALTLIPEGAQYQLGFNGKFYIAMFDTGNGTVGAQGGTLAEAICNAFLSYSDGREKEAGK